MENNVPYYDFLNFIKEASKKVKSIQKDKVVVIFKNFDLFIIKKELDSEIERLNQLLVNEKTRSL
jgi:hypothetical protein